MIAFLLKLYSSVLFVCVRGTKQSVATLKWFLALCKRMNMLLFFDLSCQNNFLIKLRNSEWLFRIFTYTGNELFVYSLNYKTKGTKRVHLANRNEENNEKELSTPQMYVIQAAVIVWCAIKFNLRRKNWSNRLSLTIVYHFSQHQFASISNAQGNRFPLLRYRKKISLLIINWHFALIIYMSHVPVEKYQFENDSNFFSHS